MFPSIKRIAAIITFAVASLVSDGDAQSVNVATTKPWVTRLLIANVWPSGYSEVWFGDYPFIRIVSNINFQIFGPTLTFETADAIYDCIVIGVVFTPYNVMVEQQVGDVDGRGVPTYWPNQLPPAGGSAAYVLLVGYAGLSTSADSLSLMDQIGHYYDDNRAQLEAQAQQRAIDEQRAAAQAAAQRASMKPMVGPAAYFKTIIYYPTPIATPHQ